MDNSKLNQSRCIIDNWSLECAATILDKGINYISSEINRNYLNDISDIIQFGNSSKPEGIENISGFEVYFGSLSNLLMAIVLFDEILFVKNGFENTWQRFPEFSKNIDSLINGVSFPDDASLSTDKTYCNKENIGFSYYTFLSKIFKSDLLLNPRRSQKLIANINNSSPSFGRYANDLLDTVDKNLLKNSYLTESEILKTEIIPNFNLPLISNLVFSNAISRDNILATAIEIRNSSTAKEIRNKLRECVGNIKVTTNYAQLVNQAISTIKNSVEDLDTLKNEKTLGSLGFSAFFVSYSVDIKKPIPSYLLFFRDLVKCRMEISGSKYHIERLFDYSIS